MNLMNQGKKIHRYIEIPFLNFLYSNLFSRKGGRKVFEYIDYNAIFFVAFFVIYCNVEIVKTMSCEDLTVIFQKLQICLLIFYQKSNERADRKANPYNLIKQK